VRRLLSLAALGALALLWLPLVVLAVFSFNSGRYAARFEGVSLVWYERLLDPSGTGDRAAAGLASAFRTSLEVAAASALLAVAVALLAALGLRGARARVVGPLLAAWSLPVLLPDVVLGISWRGAFETLGVPAGRTALVLAHATVGAAFALVLLRARLSTLDPDCVAAARDLGAGPWRATWHVVLPHLRPALAGALLLAFALSFDDFLVALFVTSADEPTLPIRVYGIARRGATPALHALATLSLAGTLVLGFLALRLATARAPVAAGGAG
jgi:spermidine/putrescine transport system permease protein